MAVQVRFGKMESGSGGFKGKKFESPYVDSHDYLRASRLVEVGFAEMAMGGLDTVEIK